MQDSTRRRVLQSAPALLAAAAMPSVTRSQAA